jgi:glycine/D-amino acid oxidase-like deaminating enzyme
VQVFHPDVYRTDRRAPSYWEATASVRPATALGGDTRAEVAIIGGGYTGLSTALHLARDHGIDAVVLEAGPIGWGASGRNGGFVALGGTKLGLAAMDRRWGEAETRRFHQSQMAAVTLVADLLQSEGIEADRTGNAHFEVAHHPSVTADLEAYADEVRRRFGFDATFLSRDAFRAVGHGGTEQFGAVQVAGPFGIHPLKFVAGLREATERRGARIHGESPVLEWSRDGDRHRLTTPGGAVSARLVVLATNGYMPDTLDRRFANRTVPALSNIIVTRPLTVAELAAENWHTDGMVSNARDLLFYYRLLPDRRFLFGARGGTSGSEAENSRMRDFLIRRLGEVFPAWRGVEVEHFWNGLVCLTGRLTPAVDRLSDDPSVLFGFGYHGNGVNTAPWVGMKLAAAIAAGGLARPDVPAPMRGLPPDLLHPLFRRLGLRAAYAWYGWRDRRTERGG